MAIKSSAETFSEQVEEKFKISELSDKFSINVSKEDIKEYGDTLLTMQEINKIKEGNTTVAKLGLEKLRLAMDNTAQTIKQYKENIKPNELLDDSKKGLDKLGNQLDSAYDNISKSVKSDKTKKIIQDGTKKAKDIAKQVEKGTYTVQLGEAMNDVFSKLKNFDIFGALISLFKGLFGMFVGNEALKKAGEKVKKSLDISNPEYKETLYQTQNAVISYIEKSTGEKFDEKTKNRLKTKLSPNAQGSLISIEAFKKLTEKIQSGKKLGINDLKESGVILNMIKDPDFKEIKESLLQNINKKLFTFFKKKFEKSGVTFDNNSNAKLKGIIKREFQNTTANKLIERTKENGGEVHFNGLEGIESVISIGTLIPNVILEAYKEDIIKVENLAIGIVESGKDTLSIGLKALNGKDIIPDLMGRMSWDDFDNKLGNIEPQKKILLERAFYAELGLVSSVLGTIGFYGTSSLVSLIEGSSNKVAGKSFSTPPIKRLQNTLDIIDKGKGVWLTEIETALKDTQRSYEIVNKLKKGNLDELTKQRYIDELKKISGNFSETKTGLFSPKNLSKITKNLNPLQSFHFKRSIEQLQQITKTNEQLGIAIMKGTFTKEIYKAKQFLESFKMRYINGRAVLNITDGLKGKEFAKAMGTLAPEIVQGLFKVAPILIVGSTIWESTKEQKGEWYETLIMLNGFMGGLQLFKETEVNYTEEGLHIKNPESFAGGIALIGMETVFVGKDLLHYASKGQYLRAVPMAAFNSAIRLPLDAVRGIGWASVRGYESLKIARAFLEKSPKKGKIGLGAAILLGSVLALEYASADEIDIKKLEKEGLIKNGEPNMNILKKKWPQFDIDKKEEIISLYSISMLEKPFNGKGEKFNFKLEDGIFNLSIDKSLKKDKKLIQNSLENVSRFLTEINSNIKLNIKFI